MNESSIEPKKKRKWLQVVIWIVVVLIILIMLLGSITYFLNLFCGQDSSLPNDQDLLLSMASVPREQNSYFDLLKLSSVSNEDTVTQPEIKINIPDGIKENEITTQYLESYNWNRNLISELIEKNTEVLETYNMAAKKDQFQYDLTADPKNINLNMPVIGLNGWRQISRISAIKAIYLMRQGNDELAFEEAMKSVIIGHKIEESKNVPLIAYLVGISMKKTGLETMQVLIRRSIAGPDILTHYQNEILKYQMANNSDPFKGEYMVQKNIILNLTPTDIKSFLKSEALIFPVTNFYYKPYQTLQIMIDHKRQQIARFERMCDDKTMPKLEYKPTFSWKLYFTENALGKILISLGDVALENVHIKKCAGDLMINTTDILFAIKKYYLENNSYPSNLQNLVPKYIDELPIDPYSGESFIINSNKKELKAADNSIFSYDFEVID
ncbi:MAG TPA: hypothetical protein PLH37_01060 [bacterium]|nr:hypothetical protein [bacterium]